MATWSKELTAEINKLDKKFLAHLKNKNIKRYSREASIEWRKAKFDVMQRKLFDKYKNKKPSSAKKR